MSSLQKNEQHTGIIDGYSSQAEGVLRINNQVVFVKGALNKEKTSIKIIKTSKNCSWGKLNTVIKQSDQRLKPDCPYYKFCGGCDTRHMTYEEEVNFKTQKINDALQRIGHLDIRVQKFHKAENTTRYRNKAIFPVNNNNIGLYKNRTHEVVDIDKCLIQSEIADKTIKVLRQWINKYQINQLRNIFIRNNYKNEALICLVSKTKKIPHKNELIGTIQKNIPEAIGLVLNINDKNTNVVLGSQYINLWGENKIVDKICNLKFSLSIPSFFQVNRNQAEVLYNRAIELTELNNEDTALDLYCGTGTITLLLAKHVNHVTGIEIVPEAIKDAKTNALHNNINNVDFICGDASLAKQADVIFVDPPRKGLSDKTIESIKKIKPKKITYISCNPATLARDLANLGEYKVTNLEAVDMFPRTKHVEVIATLQNMVQ